MRSRLPASSRSPLLPLSPLRYAHTSTIVYKLTKLPKGCERGRTVEVQDVHADATEADVRELCSSAGKVQTVTMAKGRAFVVFEDEATVAAAVQLGGRSVRGQPIRVFGKGYDDSGWTTFEGDFAFSRFHHLSSALPALMCVCVCSARRSARRLGRADQKVLPVVRKV